MRHLDSDPISAALMRAGGERSHPVCPTGVARAKAQARMTLVIVYEHAGTGIGATAIRVTATEAALIVRQVLMSGGGGVVSHRFSPLGGQVSGGTLCATSTISYNPNANNDYPNAPKNALFWGHLQIGSASSQNGSASSRKSLPARRGDVDWGQKGVHRSTHADTRA